MKENFTFNQSELDFLRNLEFEEKEEKKPEQTKETKKEEKNIYSESKIIKNFLISEESGVQSLITNKKYEKKNKKRQLKSNSNVLEVISDYYMGFLDQIPIKNIEKGSYTNLARKVEKILQEKEIQNLLRKYFD